MKRRATWAAVLILGLAVIACGGEEAVEPSTTEAPEAGSSSAQPPPGEPAPEASAPTVNPLLDPYHPEYSQQAPASYRVAFDTSKGQFVVEVHREWAPLGADRFYNLVRTGFYNNNRFFRVLDGFVAQFGLNGDAAINEAWDIAAIDDDPTREMNTRGRLTFANSGPSSRTTQLFINLGDNLSLDNRGFPPFGEVIEGMGVVDSLYADYGEGTPRGNGPDQLRLGAEGNDYLERDFPLLDYVELAMVIAER